MPKHVDFDWRARLLGGLGANGRHRVKLIDLTTGPTRGELHVYARQGTDADDYSTGLVLFDLTLAPYRLLRLNGPHPNRHTNRFPRRVTLPVAPHAHYLTERYQREHARRGTPAPDGYALPTTAYRDLSGAMDALARRANIEPLTPPLPFTPVGRLP